MKSLAGVSVDAADVDDRGLAHDRRFMVVGPDGRFLTQRTIPRMVSLGAHIEAGELRVTHRESSLSVSLDAEGPARDKVRASMMDARRRQLSTAKQLLLSGVIAVADDAGTVALS